MKKSSSTTTFAITVVAAKGDRIRLGIVAPLDVTVDRAEVHERRMQFVEVPVGACCDADAAIGVMPPKSADDTMVH